MEKSQLDKFKEAARELECDDDDQRFKDRVGLISRAKRVDNGKATERAPKGAKSDTSDA